MGREAGSVDAGSDPRQRTRRVGRAGERGVDGCEDAAGGARGQRQTFAGGAQQRPGLRPHGKGVIGRRVDVDLPAGAGRRAVDRQVGLVSGTKEEGRDAVAESSPGPEASRPARPARSPNEDLARSSAMPLTVISCAYGRLLRMLTVASA